jgi:ATP-dependent DNA helicase MPH1
MSSDGYFDGEDDFDESALAQIDAIEAAQLSPTRHTADSSNRPRLPSKDDSISFNVNESESRKLGGIINELYTGNTGAVAGPSRTFARTSSTNMVQTTLFGGVQPSNNANKPRHDMQRTASTQRNIFGRQARKTKKWDQTAFAKSGTRPPKSKDKGKGRADDEDVEDEPVEFEQFPAPFVSRTSVTIVCEGSLEFMI